MKIVNNKNGKVSHLHNRYILAIEPFFWIQCPLNGLKFHLKIFQFQPVMSVIENLNILKSSAASAGVSEANLSFILFSRTLQQPKSKF